MNTNGKFIAYSDEVRKAVRAFYDIDYFVGGEEYAASIPFSDKYAFLTFFPEKDEDGEENEFPGIALLIYSTENGAVVVDSAFDRYRPGVFTLDEANKILADLIASDFSEESIKEFILHGESPY